MEGLAEKSGLQGISTGYGRCVSDLDEAWILYNTSYA